MAKKKIFIDAQGNTMALYDDKFGSIADQIGYKEIHRASEVEFNNEINLWEVRCPEECPEGLQCTSTPRMVVVATAASRQEALDKEKVIMEDRFRRKLEQDAKVYVSSNSRCSPGLEAVQST